MRLKELEEALATSNQNCLELKESLEFVLRREGTLRSEFIAQKQEREETVRKL